jgi:hypothetical protein
MTRHPLHFAVVLFVQPGLQFGLAGGEVGIGNTFLEAKLSTPLFDFCANSLRSRGCDMTDHTVKKNPASIPHSIWHADDLRRAEKEAADSLGITLYELMQRAGGGV